MVHFISEHVETIGYNTASALTLGQKTRNNLFSGSGLSLAILPVRVAFLYPGQEHGGRTGWTGQTGQHVRLAFW